MYTVTIFRLNVANKEYGSGDAAMRAVRSVAKAEGLKAVTRSEPNMAQLWCTVAAGHLVDKNGENQFGFLVDCDDAPTTSPITLEFAAEAPALVDGIHLEGDAS
jgi:hypothetical protein